MEASLGGSRSDSSLSSFGADSLLEAGVKAGDFLQRRIKGSSHSTGQERERTQFGVGSGHQNRRREAEASLLLL